jgi:hypothetical protein
MSTKSAALLVGAAPVTKDKPLDEAFLHVYRLNAMTDALQQCNDLDPSSIKTLAAMAFSESNGLLSCLTAISESGEPS